MVVELISLELSSYIKYPFIQSLQQVLPQMSIPEGWYVAEEFNIHILQKAGTQVCAGILCTILPEP